MVSKPGCGPLLGLEKLPAANQLVRLDLGSGLERLVAVRTHPIFEEGGQFAGVAASIREITARTSPREQDAVIAESPLMVEILNLVSRIAASQAGTVLLDGESGTGKDLIAKTLHNQSLRQAEPFVAVNCAAIPATLLESELFGYEKGAFTDAHAQKRGIFELADGGTLFLDEMEIPWILQAKLLRVLEDQTFRRLGGLADIQLDVRVVAATNKNLREAVKQKMFRQDLYFRLNVIQITIPPLRDRTDDIAPLARLFIEHYNRKFKHHIQGLSSFATQLLFLQLARQREGVAQRHRTRHDPRGIEPDHVSESSDHSVTSRRAPSILCTAGERTHSGGARLAADERQPDSGGAITERYARPVALQAEENQPLIARQRPRLRIGKSRICRCSYCIFGTGEFPPIPHCVSLIDKAGGLGLCALSVLIEGDSFDERKMQLL